MTVWRKRDAVCATLGPAVVLVEHIDQKAAVIRSGLHGEGLPSAREVVQSEHRNATEVIPDRQYLGRIDAQHRVLAPTELGTFLAHADLALGPVQQGFRVAALL